MAVAEPELFSEGTCDRPLPTGELLQEFRFGQFCPLTRLKGGKQVKVVVGEDLSESSNASTSRRAATPAFAGVAARDSIPFAELLSEVGGSAASAPLRAPTMMLGQDEVATAIASRSLASTTGIWNLDLSPQAVADLLAGNPAEVPATHQGEARKLLVAPTASLLPRDGAGPGRKGGEGGEGGGPDPKPKGGEGGGPDPKPEGGEGSGSGPKGGEGGGPSPTGRIELSHEIEEEQLATWLAKPWVDVGGTRYFIALNSTQVLELTRMGATELTLAIRDHPNIYHIKISVKHDPERTGGSGGKTTSDPSKGEEEPSYDPERVLGPADLDGVVLAVYFEWKQTWTLKGFSRGRLLQSLALAPQEDTTIELLTWDRRRKTLDQSSSTETEQTMEDEQKTQDSNEVLRELTRKDEFELKVAGSLDVQYNGGTVNVKIGGQASADRKSNAEDVTRNTTKSITEGLHKSSAKVRTQRSSKVTETTEIGSEQRITRKIRNPNLCHTLNLDYFEILTHYLVTTEFNEPGMRFCAMIINPVAEQTFAYPFIRQHQGALRDALIDRSLAPGFEAIQFLRAREIALAELKKRRQDREQEPLPAPPEQTDKPQTPITDEESAANNYLAALQRTARTLMADTLSGKLNNALTALGSHPPQRPRDDDLDAGKRWLAQQLFLRSFSQLSLELRALAKADDGPQIREWGPRLDPVIPGPATMPKPSQLNLQPQEVKEGLLTPVLDNKHAKAVWDWGWWWGELKRVGLMEAEDAGAGAQIEQFGTVYQAFLDAAKQKGAETEGAKMAKQAQQAQDRLSDEDRLENDFPMRDSAIAQERAEVLQEHLKEHSQHYSFALFQALPPQEQLNYIEQAMSSITTDFDPGFFQPRVVSQIGTRLLVPLNHEMIRVPPNNETDLTAGDLLRILKEEIDVPRQEDTVLLPSPGMTIESRLGRCSAGEDFIEETRKLDLKLRVAQVRQAEAEAARLERRLTATPPLLNDPSAQAPELDVRIDGSGR
jgi:hypothetical protein